MPITACGHRGSWPLCPGLVLQAAKLCGVDGASCEPRLESKLFVSLSPDLLYFLATRRWRAGEAFQPDFPCAGIVKQTFLGWREAVRRNLQEHTKAQPTLVEDDQARGEIIVRRNIRRNRGKVT